MARRGRWPTTEELLEQARRGLLDGPTESVSVFDLEDSELRHGRAPADAPATKRSHTTRERKRIKRRIA